MAIFLSSSRNSLPQPGRNAGQRPGGSASHHEDQKGESRRHLPGLRILVDCRGEAQGDEEEESRGQEGDQSSPKADSKPNQRTQRRPARVAADGSLSGAQKQPDAAGNRRKEEETDQVDPLLFGLQSVMEERLEDGPSNDRPDAAGNREVEPTRVEHPNQERLLDGLADVASLLPPNAQKLFDFIREEFVVIDSDGLRGCGHRV